MILYHATTPEGLKQIPKEGFSLEAERVSDPGDFGWGIYFTGIHSRAKAHGGVNVLEADVLFDNPLKFWSVSSAYKWREDLIRKYGDTIHGVGNTAEEKYKSRVKSAKKWREELLGLGYDGIIIYDEKWGREKPYEVVVFKPENIRVVFSPLTEHVS